MTRDLEILDRCSVDIRATLALLKARTLATLTTLEDPPLPPKMHGKISTIFDAVTDDLLGDTVGWLVSETYTEDEIRAGRTAYFRDLARKE